MSFHLRQMTDEEFKEKTGKKKEERKTKRFNIRQATNEEAGASTSLPSAASGKAETAATTKKDEETPRWKQLLASTNEKGKAVESGQAKAETKPFETRTRELTRARAGDADALATREMKLGNTERVEKDNPYANALAAAWHSVESGYANALSMAQQGAAKIEEAYAPYAGTSHAREEMGYQTTKEDAAKKNRAAYELTQGRADWLSEQAAKETEAAKAGQGTIGKLLIDLGVQGVQMGTDIAAGAATGGGALVPMAVRVFGQGAQEARQAGASYGQQLAYGAALAAVETATEKMFDGVAGAYGKGWFGEMKSAKQLAAALDKKLASRPAGRAALKLLGSMAGEGAEELVSGIVNPIAKMIYNGQGIRGSYRENFDWSETLYEGLVGALMGGLGGAVELPGNYQDGKMRAVTAAIDSYYDSIEKNGLFSREAQGRAAEAERAIRRLTKTKGQVTQTMQGGEEKEEKARRANTVTESTAINDDPAQHTTAEQAVIEEYKSSTDGKMLEWLNKVKTALANGDQSAKKMRLIAGAVKEKTVTAVRAATGIDTSGFSHMIDGSAIQHIEERHGANGSHDNSMQNSEDMARALYVLENFDDCVWEESGGKKRTSRQFRDGNNNPAPVLRFSKKVNGTYYVVEAVPDSADKKMHIVSAYMQKNGGSVTQELNMGYPPQHTSETPLGPVASTDNSVAQNTAEVKTAENGAESEQETARAAGEETTRREMTEAQRDALEEERSRFYTYLLSGGGTEAAVNENLGKMKGDALRRAEQYIVEALNNGDIIEENGVYRRSDARAEAERRFEREKELRQSGIHGDTGWMSRKDAAHLEQLARTGGVSVEIVDTLGDAQGTYDPKTGRIQIARDATDPVGFVIQHELTHRMKQSSPEKWSEFLGYVQKHYGESWERTVEDYRRRYAEHHIDLTAEEAAEEAAADFAGRMDQEEIRRLTQENRSLAQKILDAIRSLIRRLKGGENQRLYEMEKLWASALKEGKENTAGKRNAESTRSWEALQSRETGDTINEKTTKTEEGPNNDEGGAERAGRAVREEEQNERGGEPVRRTAAKTDRGGAVLGGQRELTPSFGEKPRRTWAEGHTVEPVRGSAAYAEQETAMEYGIPSFVIADDVWNTNKGKAPAFSTNGQIYFKESVPQKNAGMLAYHELTHVMKQVGYEPYLKFTKEVAERLNMNSKAAHLLLEHEARHRKIDIFGEDGKLDLRKLHRLSDAERLKLYDELNAVLYGHIGSGKMEGLHKLLNEAFYDFPSYAAELREIHEGFKQRNGALKEGKENTANEGGVKNSIKTLDDGKQYVKADRQVIFGNDPKSWSEQLEDYINGKIRRGQDVTLIGADGDELLLTATTAGKLSDNHTGDGRTMSDTAFERKANAAAHIDELAEASRAEKGIKKDRDGRHGEMASEGWSYRTAYFEDFDGKYYEVTISAARGGNGTMLYNIGKMKEEAHPKISGSRAISDDGLRGFASSEESIRSSDTKSNPQNAETKKLSLKSYTEEEKQQHIKDAAAYFGKTDKWSETGYITTDGGRLDFSGRHEGGSGGDRTVDHRDIRDTLGDDYGGGDYSGSMVQFMSEGNIRISPESGGIDLSVKPTRAQEAALSDFISKQRGEVILDLDTAEGKTVSSTEYPRGTSASKVLADIRAYFEDGTEPQVSEVARYRYSLQGSMNAAEEAERLRAQNERLTQELDALSKELRRVDDRLRTETLNSTDRVETGRAAAELLKRFGSKADRTEITNSLLKLYDGMALGEMSRKEMKEQARAIADEVIDHVEENVNPLYEEYKELRDTLRTDKVTLPVEYRADIQDGYNEARKRAFGKVKIGNNATPVDVQYEMLNDRYPELFPSDILTLPDQLTRMLEVAESLQKEMGSPYQGMEGEGVRQSLANDILEQFFDISTTQGAKLMRMQREWEKQREKDRRATDERFRKSRERQKERLEKLEKSFQERDRKRRERVTASERRKQLAAGVERMTRQLIRPTDKKHIPAEMQDTVMAFVSMVNTESGFEWKMNPDGTYSKKHVKTGEGAPTARTVRARELKDALEQLQKSKTKNGEAAAEHTIDPSLRGNIDRIIDMGEKKLTEMTREELDTVWETYCAINAMVKNSDRMLGGSKYERVSEAAEALRAENGWRRDRRALRGRLKTLDELVNLDTMTAETFFHKLGKAGDELFRAMRNAADQQTRIVKEGTDLAARAVKDSGLEVKELEKKKETFRLESGEALTLTKAQLMELYELTKREQAQGHIFGVGIVPDRVDSGLLTEERSEAVRVTMNDVGKMLETLTPEEKKLADALQRYMSGALAMHGNEASRAVYGYDKFTEQHYWPIKVNRGETKTDAPKEAKSKTIPSFGMTNATIQDAKNGIVLRSFMDSFTEHLNQMATYSAWLATSEDLDRIHNFAFLDEDGEQTGKTTKTLIKKVFGDGGDKYWNKLMQDIALGTKAGAESNPMNKFFSNYKAAAVGFNARVVLQQPTAILRAMAVIRPKYLAEGMARKGGWKKALEHSPLAQWKDWGYFELDNGKSLRELIVGSESMAEKIRSKSMAGAGWGDSIAWGALWNAIEAETEATKRSVAPGSEEFYRIVNDRFEDVIYRTQVVDSVLNRSQAMRKSGWNLFTSFMGEPMKTANMVQRSIYDMTRATESGNTEAKKAAGRSIGRTALSVAASWAVNALMQSIADMFRDDDRDEKTLEKQPGKWVENFASNLNPAQYIPFARDFQSIMEGYDVERLDMAAFADAWKALEAALKAWGGDGKKTKGFASLDLVMQLCKAAGLPAANLERDIEDLIGGTLLQAGQWQALYAFDKMKFSTENNKTHYYESLYYAMLDEWGEYEEVYRRMLEDGFEEKEIGKGIENCVKKALGVEHVDELPARWGAPGTAQGQAWKRYVEQSSEVLGKTKDQIEKEEKQREKEKKKEEKEKEEK